MIDLKIKEKFLKDNGMSIDDAILHIKEWTNEAKFDSAENGIDELKKFIGNSDEVKELEKNIFEMKNSQKSNTMQKTETNYEKLEKKDNLTEDEKSERFIAVLSYVSYLVVVPLFMKKESALCQHHAKQGLILVIIFFLFGVLGSIIGFIGGIFAVIQILIAIYGGRKAYKGEMWVAPMIGAAAKKIKF